MPLQIGKTPIVVPRQHQFNEHVNDHQVEFARNVAQRMGTIIEVEDIENLGEIITNYDQIVAGMGHGMSSNNAKFNEELEKLVDELYCEIYVVVGYLKEQFISELFHVAVSRTVINIIILLITCAVYTYSLLHGFKGISKLANICIYMFFGLIAFVLLFCGETRYIIETGFSSLGRMIQNFVDLSTFTDPLRTSNFPQNWTIYYWAYWMVWCVAAPFFIGSISRGRSVRQTILGGYVFGVGSTLTSFIVLGNYSMGMQVTGKADFIAEYLESGDLYGMIVSIIKTLPGAPVIMVVVLLTMIAFYATSFDSIALTASCYSFHTLEDGEQPNKGIQLMWCILLILLPIALLFAESSMNNLQSVSIVAAFPIGAVIVMIAISFMKDAKKYMKNLEKSAKEKGEN